MVHVLPSINHTLPMGLRTAPYLADHRVGHGVILPIAIYLDLALTLGKVQCKPHAVSIEDIRLHEPMILQDTPCSLQIELTHNAERMWQCTFSSQTLPTAPQTLHASARIRGIEATPIEQEQLAAIRTRCTEARLPAQHYSAMEQLGIHYGPAFQTLTVLWRRDGEALALVQLPSTLLSEAPMYHIHPVLFDGAIQSILAARPPETHLNLPIGIDRLEVHTKAGTQVWAHSQITQTNPDGSFQAQIRLLDDTGSVIGILEGVRIQPARIAIPLSERSGAAPVSGPTVGATTISELDGTLRAIWQEFLELREIDPVDRFFDLGGDSIIAAQIADKAKRSGYHLNPQDILEHQTIAALVSLLDGRKDLAS